MIEYNVIQNGRQLGKTERIMHEIHELTVAGRGREILVVFPSIDYLYFWNAKWQELYPHLPMPAYISITQRDRTRGRYFSKIYIEDIDSYDSGIYDERFDTIFPCLVNNPFNDSEVIFTSSEIPMNQKSHNVVATSKSVLRRIAHQLGIRYP